MSDLVCYGFSCHFWGSCLPVDSTVEERKKEGGKVFHISSLAVKKLTLRKSFGQILAV